MRRVLRQFGSLALVVAGLALAFGVSTASARSSIHVHSGSVELESLEPIPTIAWNATGVFADEACSVASNPAVADEWFGLGGEFALFGMNGPTTTGCGWSINSGEYGVWDLNLFPKRGHRTGEHVAELRGGETPIRVTQGACGYESKKAAGEFSLVPVVGEVNVELKRSKKSPKTCAAGERFSLTFALKWEGQPVEAEIG